jgi:hypothetical protein
LDAGHAAGQTPIDSILWTWETEFASAGIAPRVSRVIGLMESGGNLSNWKDTFRSVTRDLNDPNDIRNWTWERFCKELYNSSMYSCPDKKKVLDAFQKVKCKDPGTSDQITAYDNAIYTTCVGRAGISSETVSTCPSSPSSASQVPPVPSPPRLPLNPRPGTLGTWLLAMTTLALSPASAPTTASSFSVSVLPLLLLALALVFNGLAFLGGLASLGVPRHRQVYKRRCPSAPCRVCMYQLFSLTVRATLTTLWCNCFEVSSAGSCTLQPHTAPLKRLPPLLAMAVPIRLKAARKHR